MKLDNITTVLQQNVRTLCKRKGLQLRELANNIGVAPESLSRALHGNPTLSTLCSLADALNVTVSRLLAMGGEKESEDLIGVISYQNGKTRVIKDIEDLEILLDFLKNTNQDEV